MSEYISCIAVPLLLHDSGETHYTHRHTHIAHTQDALITSFSAFTKGLRVLLAYHVVCAAAMTVGIFHH